MLAALAVLCAFAWLYLVHLDRQMADGMAAGMVAGKAAMSAAMPMTNAWTAADAVSMFLMWAVMMVAMMLPSVSPMVLLYARTARHRTSLGRTGAPVALFVTGYLIAWIGFSLLATLVNWALHRAGFLTSAMGTVTGWISGLVLIAAGVYQWTPLKNACLTHCRSPIGFLADHWREGRAGAITMGVHHGAYCVGCCWLLMALVFVLGVMNLVWIAALTAFVLLEKLGPRGPLVSRLTGGVLVAWGAWLLNVGT